MARRGKRSSHIFTRAFAGLFRVDQNISAPG
jgi:hypothetical protein